MSAGEPKTHIYNGKIVEEMSREELLETVIFFGEFIEACAKELQDLAQDMKSECDARQRVN